MTTRAKRESVAAPAAPTAAPIADAATDTALWYKDAIVYQAHVRSFYDNDGNGIGDFKGLSEKLDYLQDLGVTALWLLPFYPSPLKDDGFDIADYTGVHKDYGTIRDFQAFLKEAHRRGLKVITELVMNHTSDQHPWFQRARRSPPGSRWREFYVWSDTQEKYKSARIIFKDFESSNWSWDPVAGAYYWHRFYQHQPDLNMENPETRRALLQVVDFWLGMGVDGLRLDAVPYLFEREGTSCENLPETHAFLKELRAHVDQKWPHRMLLAEANQWPEDAIAYFGDGDECHMAFHFPVMPRLFMGVHMEDRFPIVDILQQTPPVPENCQWAVFLRNHDELTLEMVTDEDRDYMYRVYAADKQARLNLGIRRRLAPLLGNNRRRIELMNGLLFSLPGAPIIYYGDEIGMGDNIYLGDRNGVRTPMQWSGDRNAGFSRANPQRLYLPVTVDPEYHYETVNVEAQQNNPHSLLWWMKRLTALRKRYRAFARGSVEFLHPENRKVLTFIRRYGDETILVVANLSRFVQFAELDMSAFKGMRPVELFGRTDFPLIGELPYFLTLGPHAFYWFSLQAPATALAEPPQDGRRITLSVDQRWQELLNGTSRTQLEAVLPVYLATRRWFGGKSRAIQSTRVTEVLNARQDDDGLDAYILLVQIDYLQGEPETYLVSAAYASGEEAERVLNELPQAVIARVRRGESGETGLVYEALWDKRFMQSLLSAIAKRRPFRGRSGELVTGLTAAFKPADLNGNGALEPSVMRADQSNTSINFGDRFVLKLFRRPGRGTNPDLEIGRFLTEEAALVSVPKVAGYLEYRDGRDLITLGILAEYISNEGDAWSFTLEDLSRYIERIVAERGAGDECDLPRRSAVQLAASDTPEEASDAIGPYLSSAELMGQRTGELHAALASARGNPDFAPEPINPFYQRSIYQSMRMQIATVFPLLRSRLGSIPENAREYAEVVLSLEGRLADRFKAVLEGEMSGMRIRCHGDFHLGQLLFTGKDFVIIDFEGEPARALSERRLKRSPLRDVAGILRSFHYAGYASLYEGADVGMISRERFATTERWVRYWQAWVGAAFFRGYLEAATSADILPETAAEIQVMLDALILEKAVYEVGYELNSRPEWLRIPLIGLIQALGAET